MTPAPALPIVLALVGAALATLAWQRVRLQRAVSLASLTGALVAAGAMLAATSDGTVLTTEVGGWSADIGIALSVDLTSALLLTVSLATMLAVLVFSIAQRTDDPRVFHPTYLVLTAGVSLAFITGDLFNLFVSFEMLLIASYVLVTLGGRRDQVSHGMTYVVINLLASTLFITTIAFVYAACGTVNLAELGVRFPALDDDLRLALGLLVLTVFGIKAALFPLFSWLPDAYPAAPTPITAIFAGLLTKVGVYALVRSSTSLGLQDLGPILLVAAGLTMVIGVLGAIAQNDVKRILSFHVVSQIGYMVMGLGLFTVAGIAGAILFVVHQIPVKTSLFLVGGLIEAREGTGALDRLGGLARAVPLVAALFVLPALSLAGIPPFSGFVAKLSLIEAGSAAQSYVIVAVSLVGSALTLFSMTKIWAGAFWGAAPEDAPAPAKASDDPTSGRPNHALALAATIGAVGLTVLIAVASGPLYEWSVTAAEQLLAGPSGTVGP